MVLAGIFGGMGFLMILVIALLIFLLPLIALIDIIRNDFDGDNKLLWVLIVIFLPFIGSILYFLIGKGQKTRKKYKASNKFIVSGRKKK